MHTTTWLPRMGLAALCLTAACGGNDPTGPGESPAPTTSQRWDMDVTVRYVKASANKTCDGSGTLNLGNPGEYQYRISASFGGVSRSMETNNYGSVTGAHATLDREELDNFPNKTWSFTNLKSGDAVSLTMWVTEWDGTSKDGDMNNKSNTLQLTASSLLPTGGTKTDRALGVGNGDCGLTLYYDISAIQRTVVE